MEKDGGATTYAKAGVDIETGNRLVELIRPIANKTFRSGVITDIGGFSGLFSLNVEHIKNPVLAASTDGVGTKLKIAFLLDKHDTVGIDLVAMCVNDIMVGGGHPAFLSGLSIYGETGCSKGPEYHKRDHRGMPRSKVFAYRRRDR